MTVKPTHIPATQTVDFFQSIQDEFRTAGVTAPRTSTFPIIPDSHQGDADPEQPQSVSLPAGSAQYYTGTQQSETQNSPQTRTQTCLKICCGACLAVVYFVVFLGILGAVLEETSDDNESSDLPDNVSVPTFAPTLEPTNELSSTTPSQQRPPVDVGVVKMKVEASIPDDMQLLIQNNKLWWVQTQSDYHVVAPTIINCQDLHVVAEESDLCEASIDMGSSPTLLSAYDSSSGAFNLLVEEYPVKGNGFLTRFIRRGAGEPWSVLEMSFQSGGESTCFTEEESWTTKHPDSGDNLTTYSTMEVSVKAMIDSDSIWKLRNNSIQWFHVKGTRPGAISDQKSVPTMINCLHWKPIWGGLPAWCDRCTWPSAEEDLCGIGIDTEEVAMLTNAQVIVPVNHLGFSVSWRKETEGDHDWTIRLLNNGGDQVWVHLLLKFDRTIHNNSCELRPVQSCAQLFDTDLICHDATQNCTFVAGDEMYPRDTCSSYCQSHNSTCLQTFANNYGSCEISHVASCSDYAADGQRICKCNRPVP